MKKIKRGFAVMDKKRHALVSAKGGKNKPASRSKQK